MSDDLLDQHKDKGKHFNFFVLCYPLVKDHLHLQDYDPLNSLKFGNKTEYLSFGVSQLLLKKHPSLELILTELCSTNLQRLLRHKLRIHEPCWYPELFVERKRRPSSPIQNNTQDINQIDWRSFIITG
uniref:Uncharacterized protein n=1 Tax=Glossina austeni TaxID=7395 RepID=A0A1A9VLK7_GLOAU